MITEMDLDLDYPDDDLDAMLDEELDVRNELEKEKYEIESGGGKAFSIKGILSFF